VTNARLTLAAVPESVSAARRFVIATLGDLGAGKACDDAATLVSELATNAVLHARTAFTIEVQVTGDVIRVGVVDQSAAVPRVRDYGRDATTGRGMRLVSTMATGWGVERQPDGKTVWFELPVDGRSEISPWDDDADGEVDVDSIVASFPDLLEPGGGASDTRVWAQAA
jgi:anti-sigma regulatory factor (Ser/Thr protein kinase)